ncbi:HNH endonuclease [Bordetella bronchialis]|uniref:HNH endonuclease n=1 Tax=Bordetella bronchialis TaxID=463025 RepID=UPI003D079C06
MLRTLKPRLSTVNRIRQLAPTPSEQRTAGRQLQARRLRLWQANPYCACCGQLVSLDGRSAAGFEVDHVVRLDQGGTDTDDNCQVLCAWRDEQGRKQGCHATKTRSEAKG